ncbi:MAG TPA: 2-dehydropantoate 2-reductase [Plasticicumulans sp.]|nr:2-dehydropantoate 2-reductase [Plasticicumulans sp.]
MSPSGWHILGAGAIGGLYATGLAAAGVPVTVLTRDTDSAAVLMREGLTVEEPDGHELHARPLAEPVVAGGASIRRLLVVTKAQDTVAALELIAHRLGPVAVHVAAERAVVVGLAGVAALGGQKRPGGEDARPQDLA